MVLNYDHALAWLQRNTFYPSTFAMFFWMTSNIYHWQAHDIGHPRGMRNPRSRSSCDNSNIKFASQLGQAACYFYPKICVS